MTGRPVHSTKPISPQQTAAMMSDVDFGNTLDSGSFNIIDETMHDSVDSDQQIPVIPRRPHKKEDELHNDFLIAEHRILSSSEGAEDKPTTPPIPLRPKKENKQTCAGPEDDKLAGNFSLSSKDQSFDIELTSKTNPTKQTTNTQYDQRSESVLEQEGITEDDDDSSNCDGNRTPSIPERPTKRGKAEKESAQLQLEDNVAPSPSVPRRPTCKTEMLSNNPLVQTSPLKSGANPELLHEQTSELETNIESDGRSTIQKATSFGDGEITRGNSNSKSTFKNDDAGPSAALSDDDDVATCLQEKEDEETSVIQSKGIEDQHGHVGEGELEKVGEGEGKHENVGKDELEHVEHVGLRENEHVGAGKSGEEGEQTELPEHTETDKQVELGEQEKQVENLNFKGSSNNPASESTELANESATRRSTELITSASADHEPYSCDISNEDHSVVPSSTSTMNLPTTSTANSKQPVVPIASGVVAEDSKSEVQDTERAEPEVPSRPIKKVLHENLEKSVQKKAPPPKPKKLSSKISAFQQMFSQEPPAAPPRGAIQDCGSEKQNSKKLSNDKLKFAASLQGVMGRGIPLPGMANKRAISDFESSVDEFKPDSANDGTKLAKNDPKPLKVEGKRPKGPRGRKLPQILKDPVDLSSKPRFQLVLYKLWEINFNPPQDQGEPVDIEDDDRKVEQASASLVLAQDTSGFRVTELEKDAEHSVDTISESTQNASNIENILATDLRIDVVEAPKENTTRDRNLLPTRTERESLHEPRISEEGQIAIEASSEGNSEDKTATSASKDVIIGDPEVA